MGVEAAEDTDPNGNEEEETWKDKDPNGIRSPDAATECDRMESWGNDPNIWAEIGEKDEEVAEDKDPNGAAADAAAGETKSDVDTTFALKPAAEFSPAGGCCCCCCSSIALLRETLARFASFPIVLFSRRISLHQPCICVWGGRGSIHRWLVLVRCRAY
jgi:hypothetical protein